MKPTAYTRLSTIALAVVLAACSATTPDSKEQLAKLKEQQADITKKIKDLEKQVAKENPKSDSSALKAKSIAVLELKEQSFDHFVQTQGKVDAEENVTLSAKTPGVIQQVFVTEGQQVSKGQVLAQLDNAIIVRSIEAQKSQLELATAVYDRQKNLWDQKIGTEVQFLQAKTNKESLEKQLASLQEQNDLSRIKSPINGTVDEVIAKVGEGASPGAPAFRVVNGSNLKFVANVSEAYVTSIKKNNAVKVVLEDINKTIEGKVTFVGKTIDPLSRTFNVEAKLPANADLRANMTGVLKLIYKTEKDALVVPVNVIQNIGEEKVVYIAEAKGKDTVARRKVVTVEGVFDGKAQIAGLNAGDKVIIVGYQGLNDGDAVKL